MPIYEFVCPNCGHEFEKIQSFSDNNSPVCPRCHAAQTQRRLGRPAIHFKGSGWYVTDSKRTEKNATNGAATRDTSEKNDAEGSNSGKNSTEKTNTEKGEARAGRDTATTGTSPAD